VPCPRIHGEAVTRGGGEDVEAPSPLGIDPSLRIYAKFHVRYEIHFQIIVANEDLRRISGTYYLYGHVQWFMRRDATVLSHRRCSRTGLRVGPLWTTMSSSSVSY
jgi:hypothetical protein